MNPLGLVVVALLLLISALSTRISDRIGVPRLVLFLALGMLAGAEGLGGIQFDDPVVAQSISIVAFVLILFSGGFDTEWAELRPVAEEGLLLATLGVLVTALIVGLLASALFSLSLLEGLLLGSIVSSTDAAAVFSILRTRGIGLKGQLKPLLELESASNDPMAIVLTVGVIQLIAQPDLSPLTLIGSFLLQVLVGVAMGLVMARATLALINRVNFGHEGFYPLLTLACVLLTFGLTDLMGGSGFVAVYLAGIALGRFDFVRKKGLLRFFNTLGLLMQVTVFVTLGLFISPSRLIPAMPMGLLVAGSLILVARPLGVLAGLLPRGHNWREQVLVSWVGLRGAASLILATFPLLAGVPEADRVFSVVSVVVLTSALLQGTSLPLVARWLNLDAPVTS